MYAKICSKYGLYEHFFGYPVTTTSAMKKFYEGLEKKGIRLLNYWILPNRKVAYMEHVLPGTNYDVRKETPMGKIDVKKGPDRK